MALVNDMIQEKARRATQVIAEKGKVRAAYIFGSHAEGSADTESDIDLAVFVDEAGQWDLAQRVAISVEVQRRVGFDVEPHFFSSDKLHHPPSASFAAFVLAHGIPIAT